MGVDLREEPLRGEGTTCTPLLPPLAAPAFSWAFARCLSELESRGERERGEAALLATSSFVEALLLLFNVFSVSSPNRGTEILLCVRECACFGPARGEDPSSSLVRSPFLPSSFPLSSPSSEPEPALPEVPGRDEAASLELEEVGGRADGAGAGFRWNRRSRASASSSSRFSWCVLRRLRGDSCGMVIVVGEGWRYAGGGWGASSRGFNRDPGRRRGRGPGRRERS